MTVDKAIELGKEKVLNNPFMNELDDLNDKALEIIGYTEAIYYGTDAIQCVKRKFDKENFIYDMKFYKYIERELVECSFGKAVSTPEYEQDNIFLFSQMEDDKRQFYLAIIID